MERLTIKPNIDERYILKCMCHFDENGKIDDMESCKTHCECRFGCHNCTIQTAFDRLAAYEDTGLTPEEIKTLQEDNTRRKLMEQKIELKTCPYCGNKDITTIFVNSEFKGTDREEEFCFWVAGCIKCKTLGKSGKTENEAVQKWNDECASFKMERLTDTAWKNLDPWECCGQDDYCQRGCHDEGGCANGCIVPRLYRRLAAYEDTGLTPEEVKALQSNNERSKDNWQ